MDFDDLRSMKFTIGKGGPRLETKPRRDVGRES